MTSSVLTRQTRHLFRSALGALVFVVAGGHGAGAAVTISSKPTEHMSCSAGVCTPTAAKAWLNTGDLETMLASGNATVKTTGSEVQATDITVDAGVSWSTSSTLVLDAYRSVTIDRPVSVDGLAGLSILTNDGGSNGLFLFGQHGNVTFTDLSSGLSINGTSYTLENSIQSLAAAIANNPSGAYALANSYDASQDGTYSAAPISAPLSGLFEGLGNAISNLSISDTSDTEVGLFAELDSNGAIRDISITSADISGTAFQAAVGSLAGYNYGKIIGASSSGAVAGRLDETGFAGGLVGYYGDGIIELSHSSSRVSGYIAGGLAGWGGFTIDQSFATGTVLGSGNAGGLAGLVPGATITNSYATGTVKGPRSADTDAGGFVGAADEAALFSASYSTGRVKGGERQSRGGFAGVITDASFAHCYWDTTTSGVSHKGVGNVKNEPGVTGLTTEQLQSGLPAGFDPKVWAEDPDINKGLPYLLSNPPK
ncbi:MAG TPA: GLUG motif-containing protein [Rhizomicrobium sp.]|jgi:hypothetical protein